MQVIKKVVTMTKKLFLQIKVNYHKKKLKLFRSQIQIEIKYICQSLKINRNNIFVSQQETSKYTFWLMYPQI